MITLAPPAPAIATFPVAAVEACLRGELIEAIKAEALIRGISLPTSPAETAKTAFQVDSARGGLHSLCGRAGRRLRTSGKCCARWRLCFRGKCSWAPAATN